MNEVYLIPANSKKSALIFGLFNKYDFVIFGSGLLLTLLLMMVLPTEQTAMAIIALLPIGIGSLLVFPLPNYHNVLRGIISMYLYFTGRRSYIWKGWCIHEEEN